jgi:hypothetical protein
MVLIKVIESALKLDRNNLQNLNKNKHCTKTGQTPYWDGKSKLKLRTKTDQNNTRWKNHKRKNLKLKKFVDITYLIKNKKTQPKGAILDLNLS